MPKVRLTNWRNNTCDRCKADIRGYDPLDIVTKSTTIMGEPVTYGYRFCYDCAAVYLTAYFRAGELHFHDMRNLNDW